MKTTAAIVAMLALGTIGFTSVNAADPVAEGTAAGRGRGAYAKYKDLQDGKNADYIPILTKTPSELFGVVIATRDGKIYSAGDVDYKFSIQSVSKPFTAALVMTQQGPKVLDEKIGVEPTGLPFNSRLALEIYKEKRSVNPLVNAGAIAAVSLVQATSEARSLEPDAGEYQRLCRQPAHGARGRVRVRVHHGLRQSRHRQPALQLRAALQRPGRGDAGLHARSAPSASAPRTWPSWARRWPTRASIR